MDTLVHADIFFFVTTIATIIGAILLAVLLVYGILFVRDLLAISNRVKHEAELISMDIQEAREHIKKEGAQFSSIFSILKKILGIKSKVKK